FINEIASLCEKVGADASEVERGLRSDPRLGPKAFIRPGGPFAGGTLGRDISFLTQLSKEHGISGKLLGSVLESNEEHKLWVKRKLLECVPDLKGKVIAVLGLTYKPGTSTLRRSASVEMCRWVVGQGARVQAFDPAVKLLPVDFSSAITLQTSIEGACMGADVLVISTECEEFKALTPEKIIESMSKCNVIDQNRFLEKSLMNNLNICYFTVGKPI
ncbi:MAG: UDP-glucose/GDP-mannose dehydrogenase family protein, partial [Nitrospina sp.]|nr:UDP-glucose/GDP-mannose dehydrogenase family protein [Nitrospina sp.]